MATETLAPGAPVVTATPPKAAPKAPPLVHLQCAPKFDHTWGTQVPSSVGPINIGPGGEVEVPITVAANLLARRPEGEPMFTARSQADLNAIAGFQLDQAGQRDSLSDTPQGSLVYIECPTMILESSMVRDPQTAKQVRVDWNEDGIAVVTQHIYEKMRGAYGGDAGTSKDPDAPKLFFKGHVGAPDSDGPPPYFEDDPPASGPVGAARVDGQSDILGVEVEDPEHARPEPQMTPSAKLIAEFNKEPAPVEVASTATGSESNEATETATNLAETPTGTTPTSGAPDTDNTPPPTFMDSLKSFIGAPAVAALAAVGLDSEEKLRASDEATLAAVKGIGTGKLFTKIWEFVHPSDAADSSGADTTNADTNAISDTTSASAEGIVAT